jgi:hypothetical protein
MPLSSDLREFIECLNSNEVEYLVVGALAVSWHGFPRYSADIDFLIRPSHANAVCVLRALSCAPHDALGRRDLLVDRNQDIEIRHFPLAAGAGDRFKCGDGRDPAGTTEALQVVDSFTAPRVKSTMMSESIRYAITRSGDQKRGSRSRLT